VIQAFTHFSTIHLGNNAIILDTQVGSMAQQSVHNGRGSTTLLA
jgi:hypothetical protein